jgi:hypothetical protein
MQAKPQEVGTDKATTPRYDTIVIKNAKGEHVPKEVDGGEVVAWSRGHALASMDALEEFVEDLAAGNCNQPTHLTVAATDALSLMRRRRILAWEADKPTQQPPADWKTAVAQAAATARKVFADSPDFMDAIEYMEALLESRAPNVQQVELHEPFMFAQVHAGDVMDWTQDANLAECWEEDGFTVAKLYAEQGGAV